MKKLYFLMAACCGLVLSGSAAFAQAVPDDCDCDGISDADEIAACVVTCCSGAPVACVDDPPNSTYTQCLTVCSKLDCNRDLTPGFCCDPATGVETSLCDAVGLDLCLNVACSVDTFGSGEKDPPTKDCAVDVGHGEPVTTPDDGFCKEIYDGATCSVTGVPCGDKDNSCDNVCSITGAACDDVSDCEEHICTLSGGFCKDDQDCKDVSDDPDDLCVAETCDPQTCDDPDICNYWICNPDIASPGDDGCEEEYADSGTACGDDTDDACTDPDTCDGKGLCVSNDADAGDPCEDDYSCRTAPADCDPTANSGAGDCANKYCSNDLYGSPCTTAADCKVCSLDGSSCTTTCGKVCAKDPRVGCTGAPGDCNGGNLGACVSQTCGGGATCDRDACIARVCTEDVCDGAGTCDHNSGPLDGEACESDANGCTDDECSAGDCTHANNTDPCDDGDVCTDSDTCSGGACVGVAVSCDDGNCCTNEDCNQYDNRSGDDGCWYSYADSDCGPIICTTRITLHSTDKTRDVGDTPVDDDVTMGDEPDGSVLEKSCFETELWCIDGSAAQAGIACVFNDLELIGASCPTVFEDNSGDGVAVNINSTFSVNSSGDVDPSFSFLADEMGGCTNSGGVGVEQWVLVGYVETSAAQDACSGNVERLDAVTDSSLFGNGIVDINDGGGCDWDDNNPHEVLCFGNLYDDSYDGFVDAGEWAQFAPCWLQPASPGCEAFDYDEDGVVNGSDFSYLASSWLKFWCGGGTQVPCVKVGGCKCTSESNAVVIHEDGSLEEVPVQLPTREQIEAAGLKYPERNPELYNVQPDQPTKRILVRPKTDKRVRGTR